LGKPLYVGGTVAVSPTLGSLSSPWERFRALVARCPHMQRRSEVALRIELSKIERIKRGR